jgi:hypothetical protein
MVVVSVLKYRFYELLLIFDMRAAKLIVNVLIISMFENFLFGFLIDFTLNMLLASPEITTSNSSTSKSNEIVPFGVFV